MRPILLLLLLAGCAASPQTTTTVQVPIAVPCAISPVPKPAYALDSLPASATLFEQVRAIWATIEEMGAYELLLEAAVASCQ